MLKEGHLVGHRNELFEYHSPQIRVHYGGELANHARAAFTSAKIDSTTSQ